ncbi:MAG: hypothetical protein KH135_01130 [Firmicutes bacterium]|nr:hypothetical protein [Bacillota bacterium]
MYSRMYVRGILLKDNQILLEKVTDIYQLPGGIVIDDEYLKDALVRNFKTKYGLDIKVRRGRVYDYNGTPLEYIYSIHTDSEVIDSHLEWIFLDEFPKIPFQPSEVRREMLKHMPSYEEMEDIIFIEKDA